MLMSASALMMNGMESHQSARVELGREWKATNESQARGGLGLGWSGNEVGAVPMLPQSICDRAMAGPRAASLTL